MKNKCFLIILFFSCHLFVLMPHCQADIVEWFTLHDRVIVLSNFQINLFYFKHIGTFNSEGIQGESGSLRWLDIFARITDSKSKRFRMSFYPGIYFTAEAPFVHAGLSDIWFSFHYQLSNNYPFVIRSAVKVKGYGPVGRYKNFLRQNDLDLGFLFGKRNKRFYVESSLSYRYRFRGVKQSTFGFSFDKPGNEIHYKLDVGKIYLSDFVFSGFIVGYSGFEKSLDGKKISNSASSKLTIGARLHIGPPNKESVASISLMIDLLGRNEYAGWCLNLQIGKN